MHVHLFERILMQRSDVKKDANSCEKHVARASQHNGLDACSKGNEKPSVVASNVEEEIHHIDLPSVIYVSNLHPRVGEAHLQKLFEFYGNISSIRLIRKQDLRGSKSPFSYAFIDYKHHLSARRAIEKVHGKSLLGKVMVVRYANENSEHHLRSRKGVNSDGGRIVNTQEVQKQFSKESNDIQKKIEAVKKALSKK